MVTKKQIQAAEAELREAGFRVEITDEIEDHSPATFMNVWRAADTQKGPTDHDQLEAIVDPHNGFVIECGRD